VARLTNSVSDVPLRSFKRTKIIASLGPSSEGYDNLLGLIKAGANGLRLAINNSNYAAVADQIASARKAAKTCDKPVAVILDLAGPKLCLGDFDDIITVHKNQTLAFEYGAVYSPGGKIPTLYDFSKKVTRGQSLQLYGGKVKLKITAVDGAAVFARAENDGILIKGCSFNLPDSDYSGDIITVKDRRDLVFASEHDVDFVVFGNVQDARDVTTLKKLLKNLGCGAGVIAKIETRLAVDNLEEIIAASDGVMIGRQNLVIETKAEAIPVIVQQAIALGLVYARATIIPTQILSSLSPLAESSAAEIADVANSVYCGADCLSLDSETASGKYPIQAVALLKKVIRYTESNTPRDFIIQNRIGKGTRQTAISSAIVDLVDNIGAVAIVAETKSGATVRQIASRRPQLPLIAVTGDARTAQQLAIVYGAKSYVRPVQSQAALKLTTWLRNHKLLSKGDIVVLVSGRYPGVVGTTDTIKVRVLE
jgi:pyruvate kinase